MLNDDVALLPIVTMQHREGDMKTLFELENYPYPPYVSYREKLCQGNKSDLLIILAEKTRLPRCHSGFNYMAANPHSPMTIDAQHFTLLERYTVVFATRR